MSISLVISFLFIIIITIGNGKTLLSGTKNKVLLKPGVECLSDRLRVTFVTGHPFKGRIMVAGFGETTNCHIRGNNRTLNTIQIKYNSCGLVNTKVGAKTIKLTISFHPHFLTSTDRSYKITCLQAKIHQHHPTKDNFNVQFPSKQVSIVGNVATIPCTYQVSSLTKGNLHDWQCHNTRGYACFRIINCTIKNVLPGLGGDGGRTTISGGREWWYVKDWRSLHITDKKITYHNCKPIFLKDKKHCN